MTHFFKISNTDIKYNKIAECKLCANIGKSIRLKMKNCGTSALIKHLSAKHEKEYKTLYPNAKKEIYTEKNRILLNFCFLFI